MAQEAGTTELAYGFGLPSHGVAHELAARQRYSLVVIGGYANSLRRYDGWIEAGAGAELLERGSRLACSFGFGADLTFGNDTDGGAALHYLGARLAVRLTAAPAPAREASEACVGDCEPRLRDQVDLGIVVSASVVMGR